MSTTLWLGIWIGVLIGTFGTGLIRLGAFVIALLLWEVHSVTHAVGDVGHLRFTMPPVLIGIIGVVVGLLMFHFARKRGLAHLGAAELSTRWTNVRKISKWGW
jgi:hypothetical protein